MIIKRKPKDGEHRPARKRNPEKEKKRERDKKENDQ